MCSNSMEVLLSAADEAVLRALEKEVLDQGVMEATVHAVLRRLEPASGERREHMESLRKRIAQLEIEIARLTDAIAAGTDGAAALVDAIRLREGRLREVREELASRHGPAAPVVLNRKAVREKVCARLTEWQTLLRSHIPQARRILRSLLANRVTFTPVPENRTYRFSMTATWSKFFNGLVDAQGVASLSTPTWNQIGGFIDAMRRLRDSAGFAA